MAKKYTADTFEGDVTGNITGDLTGDVTGSASENVLKAGDTMTGNLNITKTYARLQLDGSIDGVINIRNGTGAYDAEGKITFGNDSAANTTPALIQCTDNPSTQELMLQYGTTVSTYYNQIKIRSTNTYFTDPLRIGADSASNELDDYEEGTYNPEFYLGTSSTGYGSGDFTTWTNSSKYVKVGRMVTLYLDLTYGGTPMAITTSNQDINIGNLPFSLAQGHQIGGTYQFGFLKSTIPSTYGYNSVICPAFNTTTAYSGKIGFTKLEYNGGISMWVNYGMEGDEFPASGPFGTSNTLGGVVTYYTND